MPLSGQIAHNTIQISTSEAAIIKTEQNDLAVEGLILRLGRVDVTDAIGFHILGTRTDCSAILALGNGRGLPRRAASAHRDTVIHIGGVDKMPPDRRLLH
jgi:hypothetical protein